MRKEAVTKENALAGHTAEACGMSSSLIKVGKSTLKPETKYSYTIDEHLKIREYCTRPTAMNWEAMRE